MGHTGIGKKTRVREKRVKEDVGPKRSR